VLICLIIGHGKEVLDAPVNKLVKISEQFKIIYDILNTNEKID
jgi:hypothetical protein